MMMKTATTLQILPIPEEIIVFEILKRLPTKTLCRFKTVCKRWLSIITTSRPFIDSHFQHSKLNPKCLFAFSNENATTPTTFLYDPQNQTSLYKWDTYFPFCSISPRGLICLYDGHDPTVQIWNPSTGERIEVNFPPRKLPTESCFFLGFDIVSKKHKLLCSSKGEHYVFTLGENKKWRKITTDGSLRNLAYICICNYCCIDGIVYYLAHRDGNDDELVLAAFDVGSESFLETIGVPMDLVLVDGTHLTAWIGVYRGGILLLHHDWRKKVMETWVLEDVEKQKWSPKRMSSLSPPTSPMFYNSGVIDGEELLFYSSTLDANSVVFRLCRYNLENGRCTESRFPNLEKKLDGSTRYEARLYYYVDNLESLKSRALNIQEEVVDEEEEE